MTASRHCPALLVAAPASGQGKTTVTAGLARLHARQGRRVRVFKCGPDFLDPLILAAASGARVYSLDLWMAGEADAAARLHAAAGDADLILVESVMGLYDGEALADAAATPSSAAIARRFDLPVLAVIDASAMAQTFGAVALGLATYAPDLRFAGVLANGVAGEGHARLLRDSLPAGIGWCGHLPRDAQASLPERHLGLVTAGELADLIQRLDRVADALAAHGVLDWPLPQTAFPAAALPPVPPRLAGRTIAVARDAAFAFVYPANLECLVALGARVEFFSPLADAALPECDALWLPGGYPELHAARLAANGAMLDALRAHRAVGKPIVAECGGMMALFETLVDTEGLPHRLAGLLPGAVAMQPRLAAIGAQQADLPEGRVRGHTFHYSCADTPLAPLCWAVSARGAPGEAVYRSGALTASYVHFYFPSNPAAVAQLFGAAWAPCSNALR